MCPPAACSTPNAPSSTRRPAPPFPRPEPTAATPPRVRAEQRLARFPLESGVVLEDVRQAFHLDGTLNAARDNLVLVFHALTGSSDVAGPDGWWRDVVGPGRAIDTGRWAVLTPNLLGSCYGTTGPTTWGGHEGDFPAVTPRDMARLAGALVDALAVPRPALVVGASLGGMVAQEWVLAHPGRARAALVFAAPAAHTAQAIGWNHVQREALALAARAGDDAAGIALARAIAMLSFRNEAGLEARFGRAPADTAAPHGYAVQGWLAHHGERLVRRFDAATYRTLLDAMDAHDLGRGRGGLDAALRALGAGVERLVAVGIPGDLLYSADVVAEWARRAGADYHALRSAHGHDAFLLETDQVAAIVAGVLGGRG